MTSRNAVIYVLPLYLFLVSLPGFGAEKDGFALSVTPYIWATDTNYDLTAQGTPIDDGKMTFDDLLGTAKLSLLNW